MRENMVDAYERRFKGVAHCLGERYPCQQTPNEDRAHRDGDELHISQVPVCLPEGLIRDLYHVFDMIPRGDLRYNAAVSFMQPDARRNDIGKDAPTFRYRNAGLVAGCLYA